MTNMEKKLNAEELEQVNVGKIGPDTTTLHTDDGERPIPHTLVRNALKAKVKKPGKRTLSLNINPLEKNRNA